MPADSNGDNVYMVTVVVTDAGIDSKGKLTAERDVVVTVTNEDENGTVTLSSDPAQGRNRADRRRWMTLTALSPTVSSGRGTTPALTLLSSMTTPSTMATSATYTPKAQYRLIPVGEGELHRRRRCR